MKSCGIIEFLSAAMSSLSVPVVLSLPVRQPHDYQSCQTISSKLPHDFINGAARFHRSCRTILSMVPNDFIDGAERFYRVATRFRLQSIHLIISQSHFESNIGLAKIIITVLNNSYIL